MKGMAKMKKRNKVNLSLNSAVLLKFPYCISQVSKENFTLCNLFQFYTD